MRHRYKNSKLNRDIDARKGLVLNLAESMILHGSITTTIQKAKFIKPKLEKLVTKAKNPTLANRRLLIKKLRSKTLVESLINNVAPVFESRNGGYTRIQKVGQRLGDNATLVKFSFVENILKPKETVADKKTNKKVKSEPKAVSKKTDTDVKDAEIEPAKVKSEKPKSVKKEVKKAK